MLAPADMLSYQYASLICRSETYWLRNASAVATETMIHGFGCPYRIAWKWLASHGDTFHQERLACEDIQRMMNSSFYSLVPDRLSRITISLRRQCMLLLRPKLSIGRSAVLDGSNNRKKAKNPKTPMPPRVQKACLHRRCVPI